MRKIIILILAVFVIFVTGVGGLYFTAAPVNNSTIYVNANGGNDNNDGYSLSTAKATIQNATEIAANNGTIYVANMVYNATGDYNVSINKNLTIIGESQTGTIINAEKTGDIFNITPGVTLTLGKLTLENGNATNGGAINNQGTLIIDDCKLQNNTASNFGGAINNYGNATATINNNSFLNNNATDGGSHYQ